MLLDALRKKEEFMFPYVNTGTLFDLYTGKFRAGKDGKWPLDGGLSQCLGITGRSQTYKSGIAGSLLANALLVHPEAEALVYETEGTVGTAERYDDFVPQDTPVSPRIVFRNSGECTLTEFYEEFKHVVDAKLKNKKDYIIDSPFVDRNGVPLKCLRPTFVLIDSYSRARTSKGDEMYDSNTSIDDSSFNMYFAQEALQKTKIMNDLPIRASKAGVYCILTAHVGNKIEMNAYTPTPKQLQYMKQTDRLKNVGSSFEFLTTTMIQTLRATALTNSSGGCAYPSARGTNNPMEVNQVDLMMVRCKNNASGVQLPFIVSQWEGILNSVTNFAFLANNKYKGLDVQGNNQAFTPMIYPEHQFRKFNLRDKSDKDYALARALELTAHLCFIQTLWNTARMPDFVNIPIEQFAERLKNSTNCSIDRVLQSTSAWSSSKTAREQLTIMDVLALLEKEQPGKVSVDVPVNVKKSK